MILKVGISNRSSNNYYICIEKFLFVEIISLGLDKKDTYQLLMFLTSKIYISLFFWIWKRIDVKQVIDHHE